METYTIYLTADCNCNCKYCYLLSGKMKLDNNKYSQEIINSLLNKIIEKDKNFNIEFLGGEPTLEPDKIINTIKYLESIPEVHVNSYIITTNGTLLSDSLLNFIKDTPNLIYQISIDGTKYFNQLRTLKTGENTFDTVLKNIKKLNNINVNNDQIRIHITLHPYNIVGLYESILKFIDFGITYFVLGIIETTMKIDINFIKRTIIEMDKISKFLIINELCNIININFFDSPQGIPGKSYVYDESGKNIIGEFQSSENKLEHSVSTKQSEEMNNIINNLRNNIYNIHQKNLNRMI